MLEFTLIQVFNYKTLIFSVHYFMIILRVFIFLKLKQVNV